MRYVVEQCFIKSKGDLPNACAADAAADKNASTLRLRDGCIATTTAHATGGQTHLRRAR
jgi:hypothetical protein